MVLDGKSPQEHPVNAEGSIPTLFINDLLDDVICTIAIYADVTKKTLNFMAPLSGWGSTASRLEPLRGGSLLFTSKFPEIAGTHFTDLGRMKG